jgi:ABC-2 type transport system ATP-binding protein
VAGIDVSRDPGAVRSRIGLVFQDPSLDDQLTARENLDLHGRIYGIAGPVRRQRIDELLQVVELADRANSLVRTFSGGMKRRLEIARGVLHHPQVLFLDEPTLGLDPQTRKHIWDYLNELRRREGVTLFMTTHYMEEAEFCDRIAIIDRGQIVALGTPVELKGRIGGDVITVSVGDVPAAAQEIQTRFGIAPLAANGTLRIEVPDGASFLPRLVRELPMRIDSVSLSRPSLDDVFLKLTGHAIRAEGASDKEMMRNMGRMWRGGRR